MSFIYPRTYHFCLRGTQFRRERRAQIHRGKSARLAARFVLFPNGGPCARARTSKKGERPPSPSFATPGAALYVISRKGGNYRNARVERIIRTLFSALPFSGHYVSRTEERECVHTSKVPAARARATHGILMLITPACMRAMPTTILFHPVRVHA